jgi:hypothetical protein
MAVKQAMPGVGQFQWNTWAWFGSQLGCTAWMLTATLEFAREAPRVAALCVVLCAAVNALCTGMWLRRDRIAPFPAMMVMLGVCMASALFVLVAVDFQRPDPVLLNLLRDGGQGGHRRWEIRSGYRTILLLFPVMAALFALSEWGARKSRARMDAQGLSVTPAAGAAQDHSLE